ncbi:MAG TPA: hypothetical protein VFD48_04300 [Pyrinomonadaceae bacterium]|nr:hypothetical protein [Pyrinomonadaceae bacterium]
MLPRLLSLGLTGGLKLSQDFSFGVNDWREFKMASSSSMALILHQQTTFKQAA